MTVHHSVHPSLSCTMASLSCIRARHSISADPIETCDWVILELTLGPRGSMAGRRSHADG